MKPTNLKNVKQIAAQTGVSIRTLHHYDSIGLLKPTSVTEAGYRLYDEDAVERLFLILLYRELGFSLKEIGLLLDAPDCDRNRILEEQVRLLKAKVVHLQNRIHFANGIRLTGVRNLKFDHWDPKKIDEHQAQAETLYANTEAWQEYTRKNRDRTRQQEQALYHGVMDLFTTLGQLRDLPADAPRVQEWVGQLRAYFTEHFYTCTPQILRGLARMYAGGGTMTENIDAAGGPGTAALAAEAIDFYCRDL